jgi:hypothetical protein
VHCERVVNYELPTALLTGMYADSDEELEDDVTDSTKSYFMRHQIPGDTSPIWLDRQSKGLYATRSSSRLGMLSDDAALPAESNGGVVDSSRVVIVEAPVSAPL